MAFLGVVYHLPGSFMGERANLTTEHMQAMGVLDSARIMYVLPFGDRQTDLMAFR